MSEKTIMPLNIKELSSVKNGNVVYAFTFSLPLGKEDMVSQMSKLPSLEVPINEELQSLAILDII